MSILPWIQYVQTPYIKISNLKIDGESQSLRDEWREERLSNPGENFSLSNFEIFAPSEYGISDYQNIELDVFFGINEIIQESPNYSKKAEKFYDENLDSLNVYAVTHGIETKFRISQKMKLIKEGSPLDDSPMYWKTSIKISKDYFGKSIYISPYIESKLTPIFSNNNLGIFAGGEINKNTEFIKINFIEKEPPIAGMSIPIEKVEFKKGVKYNTQDKVNAIPDIAINEELWVSTEVSNETPPYGYVNMDLKHITSMLEEGNTNEGEVWYGLVKKLKYSELSSSVIKTVVSSTLVEIIELILEAKDSDVVDIKDNPETYALENINEFNLNILGYFCQKIGGEGGVENDRMTSILDSLKYIDENGIDQFNSKLQVEIDKKVEIKKYSELLYKRNEKERFED